MSKNSHLSFNDREVIQVGIFNATSKVEIANSIKKDPSTIAKEIKRNRFLKHTFPLPLECINYTKCKLGRNCKYNCLNYKPFKCIRRDRTPGACNGCSNWTHCRFTKYWYDAKKANNNYVAMLKDSRVGVNLTITTAKKIGLIIKDGLNKGHSPYTIKLNHPELGISEKTIYNYIDSNVFSIVGITNIDLRRKVSFKIKKEKKIKLKKRKDNKYLNDRTYNDFISFQNSLDQKCKVIEMDTVYNNQSGPYIQTFYLKVLDIIIAILHNEKTADAMIKGFYMFVDYIGKTNFLKVCDCILTDRGTEFSKPDLIEFNENGEYNCKVFYCNPMCAYQKNKVEREHELIRYILPKGPSFKSLGLKRQSDLNIIISHINSYPRESLHGKTPFQICKFYCPEIMEKLKKHGIIEIPTKDVILKSKLIKK